jgi:Sec-independent protein translocase protein TatA
MQVVNQGLRPQEALHFVVQQMDAAGGSFKSMQKHMRRQQQQQQQQQAKQQQQQAPSADPPFAIAAVHATSAAPGKQSERRVMSHPVMLAECTEWAG